MWYPCIPILSPRPTVNISAIPKLTAAVNPPSTITQVKTKEKQKRMVYFPSRRNLYASISSDMVSLYSTSIVLLRNDQTTPPIQSAIVTCAAVPVPAHPVPSGRRIDSRKSIPLPNNPNNPNSGREELDSAGPAESAAVPGSPPLPHDSLSLAATLPLPPPPRHPPILSSLLLG